MSEIAIRVENIAKQYRIGLLQERPDTLRDLVTSNVQRAGRWFKRGDGSRSEGPSHIWALKDISFEVERGQVLGIVGRNGAGKSTLLKILSRVTDPTLGYGEIHGRVGSLLEVGTGFHPELSGRDQRRHLVMLARIDREEAQQAVDSVLDQQRRFLVI
mgnify:CR=1 FL=1